MTATSHFLGINLDNELFIGLFKSLRKYLKENNIENAISLQDRSSLHITIYYFGENLDDTTLSNLKKDLINLNKKENLFPIFIDEVNFFMQEGQNHLCYLYPSKNKKIEELNSKLKPKYLNKIVNNNYPKYIPHITIFKIKDFDLYQKHQENILAIIKHYLKGIRRDNAFQSFNLFSVNSNLSPEKYTVIF